MKKKLSIKVSAFLLSLIICFCGFPFQPLSTVKAASVADNFIDFLRTNLGLAKVNNGSLSAVSRDDFIDSLYNTTLVWSDNGVDFSFVPSNEFSRSEWSIVARGLADQDIDTRFIDYDLKQSLIKSDYINDTGSGYDLSNMPSLADLSDTVSPIDGIEVITNFSDFNGGFSRSGRPIYSENLFNSIKNMYLSSFDNLYIFAAYPSSQKIGLKYMFLSVKDDPYIYFPSTIYTANGNITYKYKTTNGWNSSVYISSAYQTRSSVAYKENYQYNYATTGNYSHINFLATTPSALDQANTTVSSTDINLNFAYTYDNFNLQLWANKPIVIASSDNAGQNYYYWLYGSPTGSFYTTANTQTIYNYDYVTNNNWENAYNNYITDVSNYYSTTENITNEQLSQYIDNSTTITNITNNYITNNGSGEGGSGENDIITNSWLERIFNKLNEIKDILLGRQASDPDDDVPNLTDNSIKNDLLRFPAENLFPDLDDDVLITPEEIEDNNGKISWDLISSKMGSVLSEVVPFCYIFQFRSIALALSAPPQDPYFEIPFFIERLGIDEYVTIDLTANAWDTLHDVWIALFMIIFLAFLFYLTHKILMLISNMFV